MTSWSKFIGLRQNDISVPTPVAKPLTAIPPILTTRQVGVINVGMFSLVWCKWQL